MAIGKLVLKYCFGTNFINALTFLVIKRAIFVILEIFPFSIVEMIIDVSLLEFHNR
jgi:hypothetical protein